MRTINYERGCARESGVTLIEVLVAVFITVLGVLGAASLQLNAIKFNYIANTRSHATQLAYDALDRMRANRGAALAGEYSLDIEDEAPTGDSFTEQDLSEWLDELATRLPAGDGSIAVDGDNVTIVVQWDESRVVDTREANAPVIESFRFESRL